jgi:hypothetical protein
VEHLFDEKDLIYSRLCLGRKKPFRRARHGKGCPYLAPSGCRLEPQERPFICHRYICQRLEEEMTKEDPGLMKKLNDTLRHLEGLRSRLWEAYLDSEKASHP